MTVSVADAPAPRTVYDRMSRRTRLAFASLLLLFAPAAALYAQPVIGPEVVSTPMARGVPAIASSAPTVAIARDRNGVAIAWAMLNAQQQSRIFVARLDAAGQVAGAVRELPALVATADDGAYFPSLAAAPDGDGFIVAWLHVVPSAFGTTGIAVHARLDRNLAVTASWPVDRVDADAPVVATGGGATWLATGDLLFPLAADASRGTPVTTFANATGLAVTGGVPQLVGGRKVEAGYVCDARPPCPMPQPRFWVCSEACKLSSYTFDLQFVALYAASGRQSYPTANDAMPAIGGDGREVFVAWLQGAGTAGGDVLLARVTPQQFAAFGDALARPQLLGRWNPDAGPTRPAIASDGTHVVVVWRNRNAAGDHDIAGASVDAAGQVTPLAIATSAADERDPSIVANGDGSFLVAYETVQAGEHHIAGRTVTFASRRRAAR